MLIILGASEEVQLCLSLNVKRADERKKKASMGKVWTSWVMMRSGPWG